MALTSLTAYGRQKETQFWKTGVAQIELGVDSFGFFDAPLINKKPGSIASVGSCFAQHVGKWLLDNGYCFRQSQLCSNQISSFALGNIYTPRCLLQWLKLDIKDTPPDRHDIHYCQNTATYFDLLRPSVNPEGFGSRGALIDARLRAQSELVKTLESTDTLIFTLGLTEAWKDTNGVFYPSCPGVIAGKYDERIHQLHEFDYQEILSDLTEIRTLVKRLNPELEIILTVSPVPLTATATDKHVLVASHYSKAVLRAVAGYMSDNYPDISYFPSFEIINVNHQNDFRFERNRRTVSDKAVEYVMHHFNKAIGDHSMSAPESISQSVKDGYDVICDEEKIEAERRLSKKVPQTEASKITLIGDSHMGKLATAFESVAIPFSGGMIMNGSGFAQKKFSLCSTEYFVPLESAQSRALWNSAYENIVSHESNDMIGHSIIISNIGLQTHQTVSRFVSWLQNQPARLESALSLQNFVDYFHEDQSEQLSILLSFKEKGHDVVVVSDPPFCQHFEESKSMAQIVYSYHDALKYVWAQFGVTFVDAARLFDEEIADPLNYVSNITYPDGQHDWIHGNDKYYFWLAQKIHNIIGYK